ncbi:flagellar protein FlhE [Onishia taeanensis]|uniref:flagellar protein FlhE n=1 Tax=Onishia taeanensis TaxID=284577 RepID=UPI003C7BEC6A
MSRYWAIRLVCVAMMLGMAPACLAAGSWVANAPPVTVAVPGRVASSEALSPAHSSRLAGRQVSEVSWRFRLPPGQALRAWLCQGSECLSLTSPRGRRSAPMSWQAGRAVHFRFLLPNGQRRAVKVESLQVIVNYRSPGVSSAK